MDTTPIYTELQQKLIDPEANNWGPSAPPEFAEELSEHEERPSGNGPKSESGSDNENGPKSRNGNAAKKSGRSRGRRHRAEE